MDEDKGFMQELADHAPTIWFWFVIIFQIVGEVRVWDMTYKLTGSMWAAAGASCSTGIPLFLWEIGLQYKLASMWQRLIAGVMIAVTFGFAMYIGTLDLLTMAGMNAASSRGVLIGLGLLFAVQIATGLAYHTADPVKSLDRKLAKEDARSAFRAKVIEIGTRLLDVEAKQEESLLNLETIHQARAKKMTKRLGVSRADGGEVVPVTPVTKTEPEGLIEKVLATAGMDVNRKNGNGAHPS